MARNITLQYLFWIQMNTTVMEDFFGRTVRKYGYMQDLWNRWMETFIDGLTEAGKCRTLSEVFNEASLTERMVE